MKPICISISARIFTLVCIVAIGLGVNGAPSMPRGFTGDYDAALKAAAVSGKNLAVVFCGSDRCAGGQRFERGILSQEAFLAKATNAFELVFIDQSRNGKSLSPRLAKRNSELLWKFKIFESPAVLVVNAKGERIGMMELASRDPAAFAEGLVKLAERAPLIERHLRPFQKEVEALRARMMAQSMANLTSPQDRMKGSPKGNPDRKEPTIDDVLNMVKETVAQYEDVLRRLEKAPSPPEIADEKNALKSELADQIERFKSVFGL